MSSGIEHKQASENFAWIVGLVAIAFTGELFLGVAAGIGCLAGIFITPDLDVGLTAKIYSMRDAKRKFPILGHVWHLIWLPYAALVPHRSWVSHWPVIGTIGRLLYLSLFFFPLLLVLDAAHATAVIGVAIRYSMIRYFVLGLMFSDFVHWLMDNGI